MMKALALATIVLMLAACSGAPKKPTPTAGTRVQSPASAIAGKPAARRSPYAPAQEDVGKRGDYTRGGLYAPHIQDSAPGGLPDVDLIPEPEVSNEPRSRYGNRSPYVVLGKSYSVLPAAAGYAETGIASFYGNKFHGRRTSSLEVYDMYAFSAAHKTLPLPSYARVTNLSNGKSVVVRVNDRGPFHDGRVIDLSYAAAVKLGVDRAGTARVEVRGLSAGENAHQDYDAVAARTGTLPAGVHIATGKPQPASAIDTLVAALPIATANAGGRPLQIAVASLPATTVPTNTDWRFDMRQDGRTMSAGEFDAWMQSRRARVATGRPGTPLPRPRPATAAAIAVSMPADVPAVASVLPPAAAIPAPIPADGSAVTLQVASFAARGNAEHALAMLRGAGIGDARLLDADANGRKVWRLRVGPVAAAAAQELVARIQGLGFGQPQRVRE
ncbi:MAG TPA: septal ring lytic transglycosylase RlpA family protein [Luteimonas sp.]|nr:septal ring lytic transglycosylase RlpA family protein [Luteimonas sp.]